MQTWRDRARPIIARVIAEHQGEPEKAIRKALREAYPWGMRKWHPYRIWCDEVNRQLSPPEPPVDLGTVGLPLFDPPGGGQGS